MEVKKWMRIVLPAALAVALTSSVFAQGVPQDPQESQKAPESATPSGATSAPPANESTPVARREVMVPAGTRIPLSMINFVSSRTARPGDPVYLETMFPITVANRVVIPVGSYVRGAITEVNRSGRIKGRAEMYIRFDSLTLPNGTTRDFNATVTRADARVPGVSREGKIEAEGSKGRDVATIAGTTVAGTSIGAIAGAASGHGGVGTAIGAGAGALAGLIAVLTQRGHEINLYRGTEVDMTLDRNLIFDASELNGFPPMRDRYYERPGPPPRNGRDLPYYDEYGRRSYPY